jgi:hypothetical protein
VGGLLALGALILLVGSYAAAALEPLAAPTATPESRFLPVIRQGQHPPTPALPTPDLHITELSYHNPDEYVQVTNQGSAAQFMESWQLHSVVGDQWYTFPSLLILQPGESVRIHSGAAANHDPPFDLLWTTDDIWLNDGDQALLYDRHGRLIDDWCYGYPEWHQLHGAAGGH